MNYLALIPYILPIAKAAPGIVKQIVSSLDALHPAIPALQAAITAFEDAIAALEHAVAKS